ncbi:unnamed protein product [Staurois parvus]|uniref:MHC class I antigen n=1 Tax=Staurois parvus TaxID=386267 RepID=A0ABN9BID0_9NEOB|nr:unnamed protein product [Staurois parvus]
MDCRHSTGDDQRLQTVQEMTRDCGQHRDDQRLRTVQEMTADLWGGRGSEYLNLTGTRSYFRGVVL